VIETLYVEEDVRTHPRAQAIRRKYPKAVFVPVSRYGEVFNRNHQSFRLQKRKPSLVLARKLGGFLMPAPYGIGGERNVYFSHLLNCLYDCRYCFLQGMYRSAHYVLFVNYEDFQRALSDESEAHPGEDVYCFSGYDGDSLVLEPVTGFLAAFLPFFADRPRLVLELRTKSAAISPLLTREAFPNCVVAFSFTPEPISAALEHGVPPLSARIAAAARLAERGWRIGLRFDPLLIAPGYRELYPRLFQQVFASIPVEAVHSVGFGAFRLPRVFHERMARAYPEEPLFAGDLEERDGMVSYAAPAEEALRELCRRELLRYVSETRLFSY
jgi:spore photoproduct lyase